MVKVRLSTKRKSWVANFPKNTYKEVKQTARGINPKITKVEYYRKKKAKR